MAGTSPFEALLQGMLAADNETREAAESSFQDAKATPDALVGNLVAVLRGSQNLANRSLSAVMLRRVSRLQDFEGCLEMLTFWSHPR